MIGFAAPWALVGLLAAALPLLLHLTQRREPPEVAFPAVRYLDDATREHRRRLKLRHWLLLAVRTLLIVALVLAAAGMRLRRSQVGGHPPSALVLIVDNSASSSAMVDGTPILTRLINAGREVLNHATTADRIWLLTADGIAHAGSAVGLRDQLLQLAALPLRFDLGAAVQQARQLTASTGLPSEVVLVSDMQRSALTAAPGDDPILVLHSDAIIAGNRGIQLVEPLALPWGMGGGDVRVLVTATDTTPVPVTISLGIESRAAREVLVVPGIPTQIHLIPVRAGWHHLNVSIPPDEFRLDDSREVLIEVAPPAVVRWSQADRFVDAAVSVLVTDGRLIPGDEIRIGSLGPGASLVVPPEDAAQLGALNRSLTARGIPWQYGTVVGTASRTDSTDLLPVRSEITKRVTLHPTGATGDVLISADSAPWLVRGGGVLLSGSRFDPDWGELPVTAEFVPLLDALLTRAMPGAPTLLALPAGESVTLPNLVTALTADGASTAVEGGAPRRFVASGVYYLLAGVDTIGAVSVGVDPRESELIPAARNEVMSIWPAAVLASLNDGPALAFAHGRGDLRKSLLFLALILVLAETMLARRSVGVSG